VGGTFLPRQVGHFHSAVYNKLQNKETAMKQCLKFIFSAALLLCVFIGCEKKDSASPPVNPTTDVSEAQPEQKKREPIYDPDADADTQVIEALAKATKENKRVILMYGGNGCGWCYKLHDCIEQNGGCKLNCVNGHRIVNLLFERMHYGQTDTSGET
jgi:thioredoxin-related protein